MTLDTNEDICSPIFSLKWSKSCSALSTHVEEVADIDMSLVDMPYLTSKYKMNGLAYIGGYIVRKLSQSIDCATCCRAMISNDTTKSHFALIRVKDNGGLVYPSDDIVKILEACDKYFNIYVRNNGDGISASKNLRAKL